jgi:hypothetical protein
MPTTTSTILDQISAEKTKISERLARLDADREKIATQLTDLETAERVLTRSARRHRVGDPDRLPLQKQRPRLRREAAGGRQEQPEANRDVNPARKARAWASVFSPWPLAKPDKNFTRRVPAIGQTTSVSRCSATSARGGSRSAMANSMRHRPQRSRRARQPEPRS